MVLKHYFKVALRGLLRQKGYTLINIAGLAVGLAAVLLIALYAWDEWRVDRYHPHVERTYRIIAEQHNQDQVSFQPGVVGGMAGALQADFPEVEQAVRVINPTYLTTWVYFGTEGFKQQFAVADPAVTALFELDWLHGSPETALRDPNAVVISESTARLYFGTDHPVGKTLRVEGFWNGEYVVTGVVRDLPERSTFRFDILSGHVPELFDSWSVSDWQPVHIYLRLEAGSQVDALEAKIPDWAGPYMEADAAARITYHLQPLNRIYLYSASDFGIEGYGDINRLRLLVFIGGFILLIAVINFINLATARATQRAREVGVRKVVGASRFQLAGQFMGEAVLITFLALVLALCLVQPALPVLNSFTGGTLTLTGPIIPVGIGLAVIVGLLAGSYPAFVLSAFRPSSVLKGAGMGFGGGNRLRKILVVFQFVITIVLLVSTAVVYQQWNHLSSRTWGFNQDEVVVLPIIAVDPAPMWSENWLGFRQSALKEAFLQHPNVVSASVSHVVPPLSIATRLRPEGQTRWFPMQYIYADRDFLDTYEIDLLAGRNFNRELLSDTLMPDILINETAVRQLGWDDPIGKRLVWEATGVTFTVIGVIRDFLNQDLSRPIQPLFLMQMSQPPQLLSLRLEMQNLRETLGFLEETWRTFVPSRPFEFEFAESQVQQLYQSQVRLGRIFGFCAGLAVVIACLGLFGLAAYTAERRIREIGIRKAFGASVPQVVRLLTGSFAKLVLVANLIAWPVAYVAMDRWLQGFAFRIEISVWIFLGVGLSALLFAMMAVGYQSIKAALSNPVDTLRYE